ncbi:MAG: DEAD/DEAH box helicase family protein [Deltaproteobacteria bacterium]|nr:DEAD/DEAH box helicase family protein [Deltaproteobacteria bacterium]
MGRPALSRLLPRAQSSPRPRPRVGAGKAARAAEPQAKAESKPPASDTKEPLAAALPPPPPALPVALRIEEGASLIERFLGEPLAGIERYALALRAAALGQANRFDQLLCLSGLNGVERYTYQTEAVRKVLRQFRGRVLLADEVGLGKTIEAGMVLREYLLRGMARRVLVLVPPALVSQWCEELESKFGLQPVAADGPLLRSDPAGFFREHPLVVASLALARSQRYQPILVELDFDMVVIDEAHHVKNHTTAGWKLASALRSRFLLLLTATPVENSLLDLFNLITLLRPGQLGTRAAFKRQFVERGDPTQPRNREKLRELIGEVMIRNTRALADIKLPPRHATTLLVEGEPAERELYAKLTDLVRVGCRRGLGRLALGLLLQEAGSSPRAVRSTLERLAARDDVDADLREELSRLARLCGYVPASAKAGHLVELLRRSREKVLVFSRFGATLEELATRLGEAGIAHTTFSGELSRAEKDDAVAAFRDEVDVMLCTEIGGEGRNLQFCATLVNYDLPWNPMKIEQRIGRLHRIGQTRPVHVYNFCACGTAEHHIIEVLDRRINLFELVIGEVDLILGQLRDETEFEDRVLSIYAESQSEQDVSSAFDRLGDELCRARRQYDKVKALDDAVFSTDYEV